MVLVFHHPGDPEPVADERLERVGRAVLDAAFRVHDAIGPGALERVYVACLADVLRRQGLEVATEVYLPVEFEGRRIDAGLRLDLLVDRRVVVEAKSVEKLHPVHRAQVLTYLRLGDFPLGYLLNFRVARMAHGIRRFVNGRARKPEARS